jgi:hypothetical protein
MALHQSSIINRMPIPQDSDLRHFLDAAGEPVQSPVHARKMGNFLTLVIDAVTRDCPALNRDIGIRCRKPGCTGTLRASLPAADVEIAWYCPACLQKGVIRNWQGTKWDRTARD